MFLINAASILYHALIVNDLYHSFKQAILIIMYIMADQYIYSFSKVDYYFIILSLGRAGAFYCYFCVITNIITETSHMSITIHEKNCCPLHYVG